MAVMMILMAVLMLTAPAHMGDFAGHAAPDQQQAPAAAEAARHEAQGRSVEIGE